MENAESVKTPAGMTDHSELVERKARELCAANFKEKGGEGEFGTVDDCWWAFTEEARAALGSTNEGGVKPTLPGWA